MQTIVSLVMPGELPQACASPTRKHTGIRIESDERQVPWVDARGDQRSPRVPVLGAPREQ